MIEQMRELFTGHQTLVSPLTGDEARSNPYGHLYRVQCTDCAWFQETESGHWNVTVANRSDARYQIECHDGEMTQRAWRFSRHASEGDCDD